MADSQKQKTILVKKADGTRVRMTMDEVRAMRAKHAEHKKQRKAVTPTPIAAHKEGEELVVATSQAVAPVTTPSVPATTTPVKDIFVDEAKHAKREKINRRKAALKKPAMQHNMASWTKEDHSSPLEETFDHETKDELPSLPQQQGDVYSRIVETLTFDVPSDMQGRLKSLIQSRIKDIRTNAQVAQYAVRDVQNGGLGFSQPQADELLHALATTLGGVDTTKSTDNTTTFQSTPDASPADVTPAETLAAPSAKKKNFGAKPAMQDIAPPDPVTTPLPTATAAPAQAQTVGPVEELRQMTLEEFRRMGTQKIDSKTVVMKKFDTLRKDSYLLYMDGRAAWLSSPVYKQFQQILGTAINNRQPIQDALAGDTLSLDEFNAIAAISASLSV